MYHLLRVLTDETLRRSFTTMERMVIDAVRGSPTALPDSTAHLQISGRSQTPMRRGPSDSSASESECENPTTSNSRRGVPTDGNGESSFYEESDSATEIDLITQFLRRLLYLTNWNWVEFCRRLNSNTRVQFA